MYETLEMLGERSRRALLSALENDYWIDFSENGSNLEQIESALAGLFGPGAKVIIDAWKKRLI